MANELVNRAGKYLLYCIKNAVNAIEIGDIEGIMVSYRSRNINVSIGNFEWFSYFEPTPHLFSSSKVPDPDLGL